MARVYQFPTKVQRKPGLHDLFTREDVELYYKYFKDSDNWQHEGKTNTLYEGYPFVWSCEPIRKDMVWYVNEKSEFGTWVINHSKQPIKINDELIWGWHPFVRKSTAPMYEPLNLTQLEMRNHVAWIVDEDGYGQYGLVTNKGVLWVPHAKPDNWADHNKALGN